MPDYPTSGPTAGWYTDPANPGQERWWGGVEWTHDTRPLQPPVATPALANVPGGGVNPFAGRLPEQTGIGSGLAGPSFSTGTNDFSAFNAVGTSPFTSPQPSFAVAPTWNSTSSPISTEDPKNGIATAGLVLSLLGFSLIGIILSSVGLKKAREFEYAGERPVGRKRARWGVGLGIASMVISLVIGALFYFAWDEIYARYLEQRGLSTSQQGGDVSYELGATIYEQNGSVAVWDRAAMEEEFIAGFTDSTGEVPESFTCPDDVLMVVGSEFTCDLSYGDSSHEVGITFTDSTGAVSVTLDGLVLS